MGKVMSLINTTIDGFADAQYVVADPEFYDFTQTLLLDIKTVAFGRHTFELFQNRWPPAMENQDAPESQRKMARVLNDKHKSVYSSTLNTTSWNNSTIVRKIDAEDIKLYKQEGNGGLLTLGSLNLVEALTQMRLIDDYYFFITPLIAGRCNDGIRLFAKTRLDTGHALKFVDSKQLKSGVHLIHYQSI